MQESTDFDFLAPLRMESARNGSNGSNEEQREEEEDADGSYSLLLCSIPLFSLTETETIVGSVFGSESVYESVADEWRSTRLSDDQETIVR